MFLPHPLPLCRKQGYETSVTYELQNFAGQIWTWGLKDYQGNTCAYGAASGCTAFLYVVCGKASSDPNCADDGKGNIGYGNTGTNNVGNYNSGDVSGASRVGLHARGPCMPHYHQLVESGTSSTTA